MPVWILSLLVIAQRIGSLAAIRGLILFLQSSRFLLCLGIFFLSIGILFGSLAFVLVGLVFLLIWHRDHLDPPRGPLCLA